MQKHVNENGTHSEATYPPDQVQNPFNFTKHILEDFSTFMKVYVGAFPTAQKKSSRSASDGLVTVKIEKNSGVILEVNAETDFVARNENF